MDPVQLVAVDCFADERGSDGGRSGPAFGSAGAGAAIAAVAEVGGVVAGGAPTLRPNPKPNSGSRVSGVVTALCRTSVGVLGGSTGGRNDRRAV